MEHVATRDELPAALAVPKDVKADDAFFSDNGTIPPAILLQFEVGEGVKVSGGKPRRWRYGGNRRAAMALAAGGEGEMEEEQSGGGEAEEKEEQGGEQRHDYGLEEKGKDLRICF